MRKIRRPVRGEPGATPEDFTRAVIAALDEAEIRPGQEFLVERAVSPPAPEDNYVGRSGQDDPATSHKAALYNFPRSGKQRHLVLMAIVASGDRGRTFDELIVELDMYSAQKRLVDLHTGGWVRATDETRPTRTGAHAGVYVATDKTLAALNGT